MKRMNRVLFRSIPVFLIIVVTLVMSVFVYNDMIETETEKCWDWLSVATRTMSEKIQVRFEDNMHLLEHLGDAVVLKVDMNAQDDVLRYLTTIQEDKSNIFDRLDILLPDNTLIMQTGDNIVYDGPMPFEVLLEAGIHISHRVNDRLTGRPSIYGTVPIISEGETVAMLIGMVDCRSLPELFPSYSYGGNAQVFLVDRADGSYLIDEWHPTLGNLRELGEREMLPGYEHVDFRQEMMEGKTGNAAFISQTSGKAAFMSYMPVEGFDWFVAVMVQEDQIFADVEVLRKTLVTIGIVAGAMLALYLGWNLLITARLTRHEDTVQRMEVERIANEAKSSFLSSMSHDIRTPLNGIVGMLDVIERHGDDPIRLKDCLKKISISTHYLMTLTDDVLDLTEIESGKLQLHHEAFDLKTLAEEVGVLVQPKADNAGVTYRMDISGIRHSHVVGSAIHLRRILINLITNAIKYNRENGEVSVSFEELSEENGVGQFAFTVADTGIGMTKEFQQSMFASFTQEHAGARTTHRGHGLGLTIVNRLVEKMNGTIHVESEKDKGSTFVVTLPIQLDPAPWSGTDEASEEIATDLTGVNILLAEDNELNMEIAQILLKDAGANVTPAYNGKRALEMFDASDVYSFDVILMDLMMPEMDGLEATRAIRGLNRPDARSVAIIAMTASTFAEDVRRCKDAGMDEHVGKPLDMAELIAKVARHSERARNAR